jgi:hypothetical protein
MDSIQFLLIAILMITTILMIVVGIQLISTLNEIRKSLKKTNDFKPDKISKHQADIKRHSNKRNYSGIHSVIDKIRVLSPATQKRKKFFVKDR